MEWMSLKCATFWRKYERIQQEASSWWWKMELGSSVRFKVAFVALWVAEAPPNNDTIVSIHKYNCIIFTVAPGGSLTSVFLESHSRIAQRKHSLHFTLIFYLSIYFKIYFKIITSSLIYSLSFFIKCNWFNRFFYNYSFGFSLNNHLINSYIFSHRIFIFLGIWFKLARRVYSSHSTDPITIRSVIRQFKRISLYSLSF